MLVDKWTISDDGLDWTFTLRSGLKFHDGQALTTADVIPSMDRVLVGPAQGEVLQLFLTEDKWSVQDALNFTIHTVEPYGGMLDGLALVIVGDTTIYKGSVASAFVKGEDVGEENILGTGPYKLAKWEVGNKVELLRYEDFVSRTEPASWHAGEKKAYVDGMTWFEIPSEETKIAGLKTGEWDFVDSIGLDFVKSLQQDDNIKFTFYPGHRWYMGFNTSEAPLDNNTVRLAIQAALDSEAMMQTLGSAGDMESRLFDLRLRNGVRFRRRVRELQPERHSEGPRAPGGRGLRRRGNHDTEPNGLRHHHSGGPGRKGQVGGYRDDGIDAGYGLGNHRRH